eukprot:TRINITY_DN64514_c0_g1_i1.p1 TRINITY_DN64514_c0_g1~~TRINITY_DN64514_c0_g1_i1.p1  ORF type:complete len:417 (+),score=85.94 TRINITY_DN64514_c0_g1_i1:69-1319(+)
MPREANAVGEAGSKKDQFAHLTGARCLAALWIVCAHYLPKLPSGAQPSFNGAVYRVNVAVCFFVVVSGFVTHWAYGSRQLEGFWSLAQFYARRLGRVVFTFWVAMAFAVAMLARSGMELDVGYLIRCALFIEQWVKWCPNGPSWFVFVLLPSWILYPLTRRAVEGAETRYGGAGLFALLGGLWVLSFGPAVVLLAVNGTITMQQHSSMTFWPPAQMADFTMGMTTAALVKRAAAGKETCSPLLADASLLLIVLVVFLLPRPEKTWALHLNGWEPLLDHGLALPIAGFLLGSCAQAGEPGGLGAKLLAHKALASLGEMSFEVYIFQRPMHDAFGLFFETDQMEVFMVYLLVLWIFAGGYCRYVQAPVDAWLKHRTTEWARSTALDAVQAEATSRDSSASLMREQEDYQPVLSAENVE